MGLDFLNIKGYSALAPMAGVADRAMRETAISFGASYTVTELISAKGIVLHDRKSKELLTLSKGERPIGIQLFGGEPDIMSEAIKVAEAQNPEFIDINMGCPAPKVAGNGGGSALLRDLDLLEKVAKSAVNATKIPVTAKIRLGWDKNSKKGVEIAKRLESVGIRAVTVHGRTRDQMYAPPVDIPAIAEIKNSVKIPIIANGDIVSPESAKAMYQQTGCDFIMVGRASMGNPWIFKSINAYLERGEILPPPTMQEKMQVMLSQIEKMKKYKSERVAILESRKYTAWYIKGLRGAAELRRKCAEINSFEDVKKIAETAIKIDNNF